MDALILAAALATATPSATPRPDPVMRWQPIIAEAAQRFALPAEWIARVLQAESEGRTRLDGRPIRSPAGAIGLMQLMPQTWAEMRGAQHLGSDPDDPHDNVLAGAAYLRSMYDRFGYPGLFGAYNAGPARYAASLDGRLPLPRETLAYLATLTGTSIPALGDMKAPARASLFAVRHDREIRSQPVTTPPVAASLFAIGGVAP